MDRYTEVADRDLSTRKANEFYIRRVIKPAPGRLQVRKIRGPLLDLLYALQVRDIDLENGVLHLAFNYVVVGGRRFRLRGRPPSRRLPRATARRIRSPERLTLADSGSTSILAGHLAGR